jgi:hypothetical protein
MMKPAEIRQEDVRSALRQLSRDFSAGQSGLVRLDCVQQAVAEAGFSISEEACSYELGCLLQEIASDELERLRCDAGLRDEADALGPETSFRIRTIHRDFSCSEPLLESWSALYHLYLRPELGLDLAALERLLGDRHRRTLQRRVARGVQALTERLWQRERDARAFARLDALRDALPPEQCAKTFGLKARVDPLYDLLFRASGAKGIVLSGPGGSGKTELARAIAKRAIVEGKVRVLHWRSASDPRVRETGCNVDRAPSEASLPEPRSAEGLTLLVVDDLNRSDLMQGFDLASNRLDPGLRVLLVGRAAPVEAPGWRPVLVPSLEPEDALALLRHEAGILGLRDLEDADDEVLSPLAEACAFLPLALLRAVRALRLDSLHTVIAALRSSKRGRLGAQLGHELWSETWAETRPSLQRLLGVVARLQAEGQRASLQVVAERSRQSPASTADDLANALEAGLLLPAGDVSERFFVTAPFLGRFVTTFGRSAPVTRPTGFVTSRAAPEEAQPCSPLEVGPSPARALPSTRDDRAGRRGDGSRRNEAKLAAPALSGPAGKEMG